MSCWKCGAPCEDQECERCAAGLPPMSVDGITLTPAALTPPPIYVIDWDKVTSFEDMREIMRGLGIFVMAGSHAHKRLKRFLKGPIG